MLPVVNKFVERAEAALKGELEETKKRLQELKKQINALKAVDGAKDGGKKKDRLLLKTPKVRAGRLPCTP